jgi:hypothetical protein
VSELLGPDGSPVGDYIQRKASFQNKKATPPKLGESFGNWAGRTDILQLPGGGVIQFDLAKLTVQDFRGMRDHYQVNASLAILAFMQHQSDWHVECSDKRIRDHVTEELTRMWTQLNRSMATANWAGYSPNVLQWDNDIDGRTVRLDKVKDLIPEECEVNWKLVEGWAPPGRTPPKFKVYDGIKQFGQPGWPIPVENSLWYPMLMENGDYYGRKLLRPAFTSWFFSILLHLFANRYYERFGEPVPVGRAPFDEEINVGTDGDPKNVRGNVFMADAIQQLRSRSILVLPNDSTEDRNGRPQYDYDLEYLESQMRGADFERYMTRLDEEISIGLFTPILMLRTADVGSYNLGEGHERTYQVMLNSMNADRKLYLDKYVISKMIDYNFGPNAERATITFRKLGQTDTALLKELLIALVNQNKVKVDIEELGQATGMTIEEVKETLKQPPAPGDDPATDPETDPAGNTASNTARQRRESRAVAKEIVDRVRGQIESAFRSGTFDGVQINMGYKRKMEKAIVTDGCSTSPIQATNRLYGMMDYWLGDVTSSLKPTDFSGPEEFMSIFSNVLDNELVNVGG